MITFNRNYFFLFLFLFFIEVCIALFVRDAFIRPYFGDFLATICLYALLRTFINLKMLAVAILSLVISFIVETLQYFNWGNVKAAKSNETIKVVLGSSFDWGDMLAYVLGFIVVVYLELKYND